MLARFVVNSHVKHHPNAASNNEENEDEDEQQVGVPTFYLYPVQRWPDRFVYASFRERHTTHVYNSFGHGEPWHEKAR